MQLSYLLAAVAQIAATYLHHQVADYLRSDNVATDALLFLKDANSVLLKPATQPSQGHTSQTQTASRTSASNFGCPVRFLIVGPLFAASEGVATMVNRRLSAYCLILMDWFRV